MRDTQPGTPTVTATVGTTGATQTEIVTAPNAPLTLGGGGNTTTYAEGSAPIAVDPALTVTDTQSSSLVSATATISSGLEPGDLLTAATPGTGITASYSNATLTLTGTASLATYQAVLQGMRFSGTTTAGGSRTILWTANDGITTASAVSTIMYTAPPGAPVGVAAAAGDGQATISFEAPGSNGGAQVTSYTVTSSPGGLTASGVGSPITVTGLANGTPDTFTVTATNSAGTGPPSAASNPVTPSAGGGGSGGGGGGGTATNSGTATASTGSTSTPTPPASAPLQSSAATSITSNGSSTTKRLTVSVTGVHAVGLAGHRTSLSLTIRVSRMTTLVMTLLDSDGHQLATWDKRITRGTHHLSLLLPLKARHARGEQLRLTWPSGHSEKFVIRHRVRSS